MAFLLGVFNLVGLGAFADYTVATGATIDATTITGQSGVLTVNGRLNISSNVALLGFTSVVINGPDGQIYWTNNADLSLAANTNIVINNPALGLQPTIGNAVPASGCSAASGIISWLFVLPFLPSSCYQSLETSLI